MLARQLAAQSASGLQVAYPHLTKLYSKKSDFLRGTHWSTTPHWDCVYIYIHSLVGTVRTLELRSFELTVPPFLRLSVRPSVRPSVRISPTSKY